MQLSTTRVDEVEETARWAQTHGVEFLKGSILVYPDGIRAGHGEIMYGGDQALYQRILPVLRAMGGRPILVGGQPADAIVLTSASYSFLYSALLSFLLGAAICHRGGISVDAFRSNVIEPFIRGGSLLRFLNSAGRAAAGRRYDQGLQATLDVWNDALRQVIADVDDSDIDVATLRPLKGLLDRAAAEGYGQKDIASVVEVLLAGKHEPADGPS